MNDIIKPLNTNNTISCLSKFLLFAVYMKNPYTMFMYRKKHTIKWLQMTDGQKFMPSKYEYAVKYSYPKIGSRWKINFNKHTSIGGIAQYVTDQTYIDATVVGFSYKFDVSKSDIENSGFEPRVHLCLDHNSIKDVVRGYSRVSNEHQRNKFPRNVIIDIKLNHLFDLHQEYTYIPFFNRDGDYVKDFGSYKITPFSNFDIVHKMVNSTVDSNAVTPYEFVFNTTNVISEVLKQTEGIHSKRNYKLGRMFNIQTSNIVEYNGKTYIVKSSHMIGKKDVYLLDPFDTDGLQMIIDKDMIVTLVRKGVLKKLEVN